ncbi:MAG TPA: ion channel [Flavobacterium sp.]|nr:ion channel [Flavobacterium sp.]
MKKSFLTSLENIFSTDGRKNKSAVANGILLFFTLIAIFVLPIFPKEDINFIYTFTVTGIFISAVFSLKKNHQFLLYSAVFLSIVVWISFFSSYNLLKVGFRFLNFLFFLFLVASLISQVSSTATVTAKVIVDSITGYFLLGFAFSLVVILVSSLIPGAYNVSFSKELELELLEPIQDNIYYTFMTFTTTGYGDVVPTHPVSKSLAVLISASGQLYVAIIIAMLIGKYASTKKTE